MSNQLILPSVEVRTLPAVKEIITAIKVQREVLASDEEITCAWSGLPRELNKIPPELRGSYSLECAWLHQ